MHSLAAALHARLLARDVACPSRAVYQLARRAGTSLARRGWRALSPAPPTGRPPVPCPSPPRAAILPASPVPRATCHGRSHRPGATATPPRAASRGCRGALPSDVARLPWRSAPVSEQDESTKSEAWRAPLCEPPRETVLRSECDVCAARSRSNGAASPCAPGARMCRISTACARIDGRAHVRGRTPRTDG